MTVTDPKMAEAVSATSGAALWKKIDRLDLLRTVFTGAITAALALGATWPNPRYPALALIGLVVGGWPILQEAVSDTLRRRMSMELSMLIAIIAAAAIGEWVTALVVTTFVLAAEILEDLALDRGQDALTDLMTFLPQTVLIREEDDIRSIPLGDVVPDQVVVVPPGGRVPVDGVVIGGESTVDQARITGEPLPVDVEPGSDVFAGSINQVGPIEVRAQRVGSDSSYGQIVESVRESQESEPPVQRLADKLASWLIYMALIGAVITYIVTRDLESTIAVVVVAGACGVAAGTPLAILAAIARIARSGAFIKDGTYLETLSTVDTVVFDKTGTLTEGAPKVIRIEAAPGVDKDEVLRLLAAAETYSEHPLAQAIVEHASGMELPIREVQDFTYEPGLGVTATVSGRTIAAGSGRLVPDATVSGHAEVTATAVHVSVDGTYAGTVLLADTIRPHAAKAVADLEAMGIRTQILTGDQELAAQAVATELGIHEVKAGLLPNQKLEAIDDERAEGHVLAMVGDGVNDAPALAHADVGIAMGSGTQIARHTADIELISSDLADLVQAFKVARRARRIVMFNFLGTIIVDVVGIALAALGFLSPIWAAFIHVGSETAFILNSARLIPSSRTGQQDK